MRFAYNADQDQPTLDCPLTMGTAVYVEEQRILRSDCTNTHADLDLRCPYSESSLMF